MTKKKPVIFAKKSYKDGHVAVELNMKCGGYNDRATIKGHTDIPTELARDIARTLIECADKADAKMVEKLAANERRKKYQDREIAAGRMVVMNFQGFK